MATIRDFGIPAVGFGILEPKRKNKFRVTFSKFGFPLNPSDVSLQVTKVGQPKLDFQEVQLHRYNSRAWVAGKHEWSPISITFEDDITSRAIKVVREQMQRQQQIIGLQGPYLATAAEGSAYKFATIIDQLDGNQAVLSSWFLEGCWIKSMAGDELTYEDGGQVTVVLEVRFDHARFEVYNYDSEGKGSAIGGDAPTGAGAV